MASFVVEPSVAVKWFVPEVHSREAVRLLEGSRTLIATDLMAARAGGIVAVKCRLGELTPEEGRLVAEALMSVPFALYRTPALMLPALDISVALALPLPDCLNLALAVLHDCRLVTAKPSVMDAVGGTGFSMHVKWVGDVK